ncbi:hypothetical protein HMPREF0308_1639 [Corynebacterium striatum ATCC 6940]|nr:hypothetical protein HMPREF0308_1639 [Corynebacterium striatum ATCC 6940]
MVDHRCSFGTFRREVLDFNVRFLASRCCVCKITLISRTCRAPHV